MSSQYYHTMLSFKITVELIKIFWKLKVLTDYEFHSEFS